MAGRESKIRRGYTPPAHCLIPTVRFNPGTLETLHLLLNWQTLYITSANHVKGYPISHDFLIVLPDCLSLLLASNFSCHFEHPTFIVIASEARQSKALDVPAEIASALACLAKTDGADCGACSEA